MTITRLILLVMAIAVVVIVLRTLGGTRGR
jgi:hypothetical protein